MENVITAVIVIGLLILAILGLSERSFSSQSLISESSQVMQERAGDRARTALAATDATTTGSVVQITMKNTGGTKLADWPHWDVMLQYTSSGAQQVKWYPYTSGAGGWRQQIFTSLSPLAPEAIEPGILNPGEFLVIQIDQSGLPVDNSTTNLATIVTPNGIAATSIFTH
jgi:hypothetical protein